MTVSSMTRYAYLHGFASSPASRKGSALSLAFERLQVPLERPDLNTPSFSRLTATAMLEVLDRMHALAGPGTVWRFIGSSLGGWLAALWAFLHPEAVERLLLLAPAFAMQRLWPRILGRQVFDEWQRRGEIEMPDARGQHVPVHFGLYEDMCRYPEAPSVYCPTTIIHGVADEVVPVEHSRSYTKAHRNVRLIEVPDRHDLANSLDLVVAEACVGV